MNTKNMSKQTARLIKQADQVIHTVLDIIEEQEPRDDSELVGMYYLHITQFTARLNDRAFDAMKEYLSERKHEGLGK